MCHPETTDAWAVNVNNARTAFPSTCYIELIHTTNVFSITLHKEQGSLLFFFFFFFFFEFSLLS
jgi:hypothetical protein